MFRKKTKRNRPVGTKGNSMAIFKQDRTIEQIRGLQFEVWCEKLFKQLGYLHVRRNVKYYQNGTYRQVDLEYFKYLSLFNHFVILEMKYSGNGMVGLKHHFNGKKKKKSQKIGTIDNIVVELEERRKFVNADTAILVTNNYFQKDLKKEAGKYNIELYDRDVLTELDKKRILSFWKRKPINQQIRSVNWKKYQHTQYTEKL